MSRRTLDIRGNTVVIRFPFDEDLRHLCREHGARWSPELRAWTIAESKSNDIVNLLHRHHGFEVA